MANERAHLNGSVQETTEPPENSSRKSGKDDRNVMELAVGACSALVGACASVILAIESAHAVGVGNQFATVVIDSLNVALYFQAFSVIFSGLMWMFYFEQLIEHHFGKYHQTWNESVKETLEVLIDECQKQIISLEKDDPEAFRILSGLLNEAVKNLENDDIFFAKKSQNKNFSRFFLMGTIFATTLGLFASPYAGIAIAIIVLIACIRYVYEMGKIKCFDTHLDRAFDNVEKTIQVADEYGVKPFFGNARNLEVQTDLYQTWQKTKENLSQPRRWFSFWLTNSSSESCNSGQKELQQSDDSLELTQLR